MENRNHEVGIVIAGRIAPYLSGVLPRDFPKRLERLREASGLTWNAFADASASTRSACTGGAGASSPTADPTTPS